MLSIVLAISDVVQRLM